MQLMAVNLAFLVSLAPTGMLKPPETIAAGWTLVIVGRLFDSGVRRVVWREQPGNPSSSWGGSALDLFNIC